MENRAPRRHKSPARAAALEALVAWEGGTEAMEAIRERVFGKRRLSPADRSLAMEMTQGVLRHRLLLDRHIDALLDRPERELPAPVRSALRLGDYQLLFLQKIPSRAVLNETVELLKGTQFEGLAPLVNAVLRKALDQPPPAPPPFADDPAGHLTLAASAPRWLVERLGAAWGWEEAKALLTAINRPAPLAMRVNTLRAARDEVLARLAREKVPSRAGRLSAHAIVLEGGSPSALGAFREGLVTVQDEGAQLLAPLLAPAPGQVVLDACAAPGGKAGHLAQLMGGKGTVLAADISPARCRMARSAMARLGYSTVECFAGDMTRAAEALRRPVDLVLLDAPCTGTGVLRRHPEGKWRKDPAGIPALVSLQGALLAGTSAALRPGGRLLYTTCSLLPEENEEVVDRFLASPSGAGRFARVPVTEAAFGLPPGAVTARGEVRTWPHRHDCDGFFAALLERR